MKTANVVSGPVAGSYNLADADLRMLGEQAEDQAGNVATGDADGDTLADLFVGAPGDSTSEPRAGAVYVVLSPAYGTISLSGADAKWWGAAAYDQSTVASVDDLDGDGVVELIGWGEGRDEDLVGLTYVVYSGGI